MMKKKTIFKILNVTSWTVLSLAALAVVFPVFVCDQFGIGGESMRPTLETGDHILVNKLLMGARIYTKYDFSGPDMECFRMPGFRNIRPGDVAVFNYPRGRDRKIIEFRINYVYAKRCIGSPGDSVSIVDGCYRNSSCPERVFGSGQLQRHLSETPEAVLLEENVYLPAFPFIDSLGWSVRDFGPMYVPGRGDAVILDPVSAKLYEMQIEFETGVRPVVDGDTVLMDGKPVKEYRFRGDWYFFGGDNVLNSKDSRYIGLVPEEYIVGIATHVIWKGGRFRFSKILE